MSDDQELSRDLDVLDAAAVAVLQRLIGVPADGSWPANTALTLAASVAKLREQLGTLRAYRRDQISADTKAAESARQKAAPRQYRRSEPL